MIFGIIILVIAVVSSTLAYYIWSSGEQIKISTTVGGAYVYFDGGSAIENATLRPVADKSKGITKNISMRADATGVTANVYLDLVTLPDSLKDVSFRYAIYNGSILAKEGNFSSTSLSSSTSTCTANSTTHITLLSNVSVPTTKRTYTLYINSASGKEKVVNNLDGLLKIKRAKVGNKLVTFDYSNNNVSISIQDFYYEYDVLIDVGHGGWDTGADNNYILEKNMKLGREKI